MESCTICTFSFHPILYSVLPVYRLWSCSFSLLICLQVSSAAVKTRWFQHPDKKWPLMSSLSHTDFIRCLCQGHESLSSTSSTNSNLLSELLNCLRRHVKSVGGVTEYSNQLHGFQWVSSLQNDQTISSPCTHGAGAGTTPLAISHL